VGKDIVETEAHTKPQPVGNSISEAYTKPAKKE
jgi:hypothetical protein